MTKIRFNDKIINKYIMNPMLNIAIQAIRKAGSFIIKKYEFFNNKNINPDHKNNVIHNIHKESNSIITTIIKKFYPLHTIILSYEKYNTYYKYKNTTYWIIDSIGNDINYLKQFPFFALSIAVIFKNNTEIGVIYDPIHNELFSACRGRGAQLNGYRMRVSTAKNLYGSILAISCSYDQQHIIIDFLKKLCNQYIEFRYTGVIALDLAYVAVGRVDGFFATSLQTNNNKLFSGALIIQESGGLITNFKGSNNYYNTGNIIAGNAKITKILLSII